MTHYTYSYSLDSLGRRTKIGSLLVSSDQNGNLTSDEKGNSYTYDAQYIAVGTDWIECAAAQLRAIAVGQAERARATQIRLVAAHSGTNTMTVGLDPLLPFI